MFTRSLRALVAFLVLALATRVAISAPPPVQWVSPTGADAVAAINGPNPAQTLKDAGWTFRAGPDVGSWTAYKADGTGQTRVVRFDRGAPQPNPAWAGNVDHFHNNTVETAKLDDYFAKKTNGTAYDGAGQPIAGGGDAAKENAHIRSKLGQAELSNNALPADTLREMQQVADEKARAAAGALDRVQAEQSKLPPNQRDAGKVDTARAAAREAAAEAAEMRYRAPRVERPAACPKTAAPLQPEPVRAPGAVVEPPPTPKPVVARAPVPAAVVEPPATPKTPVVAEPPPAARPLVPKVAVLEPPVAKGPGVPARGGLPGKGGGVPSGGSGLGAAGFNVAVTLLAAPAADALFPDVAENRDRRLRNEQALRDAQYQDARVKCWSEGTGIKFKSHAEVQEYLGKHGGDYVDFKNCTVDSDRYPDGSEKKGFGELSIGLRWDDWHGHLYNIYDRMNGRDLDKEPLTPGAEKVLTDMLKQPDGQTRVRKMIAQTDAAQNRLKQIAKEQLGSEPSPELQAKMTDLLVRTDRWSVENKVKGVKSAYEDVLGRKPEEKGLGDWLQFEGDQRGLRARFTATDEFKDTVQQKFKTTMSRDVTVEEMQTFRGWFTDGTMPNQARFDEHLKQLKAAGVR